MSNPVLEILMSTTYKLVYCGRIKAAEKMFLTDYSMDVFTRPLLPRIFEDLR